MYHDYFGLRDAPFSIAPDPRYLYLTEKHREALAHLLYGVGDQGGFVVLTGEVGTGKTTVCRSLLQQMPVNADVAFVVNPRQSVPELLQTICSELHIATGSDFSSKEYVDLLNEFLLENHARGRNTIVIIDEAQNLSVEVLEQLRLLTNLETDERKLLQLILLGQPELNDLLASHALRQLSQRVTARYHLRPLNLEETESYILHRLQVAGCDLPLFTRRAIRAIFRASGGIPRLINLISDRALLGVYAHNLPEVDHKVVAKARREVMGELRVEPKTRRRWQWPLAAGIAAVAGLGAWYLLQGAQDVRALPSIALQGQDAAPISRDALAAVDDNAHDPQPAPTQAVQAVEAPALTSRLAETTTATRSDKATLLYQHFVYLEPGAR